MNSNFSITKTLLYIFLGVIACKQSSESFVLNSESIHISSQVFSHLDRMDFRVYHIQRDSLISYNPSNGNLSKISLFTQERDSVSVHFFKDFQPFLLHYISNDSILFYDGSQLLLWLDQGKSQKSFALFPGLRTIEEEVYSESPYERISNQLLYNSARKSVLFYFAKAEEGKKRIFAEYSLERESWNSLPVYHPQSLEEVKLNYTTFPSVTLTQNGFAFIYSISPVMVQYSWGDSQQEEKTVSSFEGKQEAEPQTERDNWSSEYFENWALQSPNYLKLIFDSYRNVYYRISQEALNRSPSEGQEYYEFLIQNRQMYLTVLDPDFEVLANYHLEKAKYDPKHAFVFSKGLWIPYTEAFLESEEGLQGDLFVFKQ